MIPARYVVAVSLAFAQSACQSIKAGSALAQSEAAPQSEINFPADYDGKMMPFISHRGTEPLSNALALNLPYEPIKSIRSQISQRVGKPLKFFNGWNANGEAHVTVITPPEFANVLSKHLSMKEIEDIALDVKIQSADLTVYGIGSGTQKIEEVKEETFFLIVDSARLRQIRSEIWKAYVKKGGSPRDWDPAWFFPHITIGFTKRDIHEPYVIKNIRSSYDYRFKLARSIRAN